ncbi:integrin alpha-PS2 isoform X2 [Frankliniella occidentalis]|uniref:Integrin alpha-PS2 isoform X2 n=1 Tax=Frankliniella occidentalis TaxID=133901 RepID=A0A9C6X1Q2_FRAOC|nr:integrin alpha-PS2 isoform X2 [Frankliniella occidentalis]
MGWAAVAVLWCLVLAELPRHGFAFNVDVESAVPYRGVPGSMFGFTVAEHRDQGRSWVLVGAPEAQTSQPGVSRGGAVYRCDIRGADHCQEIPFDRTGSNNNSAGQQMDDKSNQWFGATLYSSNGTVVACAPRYVYFAKAVNRKDPVGTCWVSREGFSKFSEYAPCRTKHWGYHRQGSCQAGLGAAISQDGMRLFIGAPGSWYWQGQVHSESVEEGGVVVATGEGSSVDDDSYLGYSATSGDFDGNGVVDVAFGMPRGSSLMGRVVVYSWNLVNLFNRTGDQMGSYFAYALAAVDVDGDGLDDLVIGAPLFTHYDNNDGKYETGRVYVIYQGSGAEKSKFREVTTLDGKNSKARFGMALCSLGDVNKDGFGDFAVGAPYDGVKERGAVYIYHGSKDGVMEKASQVILAEDINHQLSTFGFSLSGGLDLDNNEYPDLAVGAYDSDSAVFFRSRPVVKMTGQVAFSLDSKQISLDQRNCTLRDGTRVSCVPLNAYLKYGGVNVDDSIELEVQFVLDARKPKGPRMFFVSDSGRNSLNQTVRLDKNVLFQKSMFVYIKPDLRDKLTPLDAEMRYSMQTRRVSSALPPILDQDAPPVQRDSISIQKNCGRDNVCIPDLQLVASSNVSKYLLDSEQLLAIDVQVRNDGEDAFETTYEMKIPTGMDYKRIQMLDKGEREIPVLCSPPSVNNNNTLRCDIGNPLPKNKQVHFKVLLQPFHREGMAQSYELSMAVNSTNPENKNSLADNAKNIVIPIHVDTSLILEGTSHPSDLHFNTTQYRSEALAAGVSESEIGPQVVHVYSIRNKGPSGIKEAQADFLWPAYTLSGEPLLYLLEQPETSGPVKCQFAEEVNPLGLVLERRSKSFLESSIYGALGSSGRRGGEITEEERLGIEQEHREEVLETSGRRQHGGGYRSQSESTHYESRSGGAAVGASSQAGVRAGAVGGAGVRNRGRGGSRTESSYEAEYERGGSSAVQGGGATVVEGSYRGSTAHQASAGRHFEAEHSSAQAGGRRVNVQGGGSRVEVQGAGGRFESESGSSQAGGRRYESGTSVVGGGRTVMVDHTIESGSSMRGQGAVSATTASSTSRRTGYEGGGSYEYGAGGARTYSHETSQSSNSSWSSEDGGRPRVHSSSSWRSEQDGVVREGSSSTVGYADRELEERQLEQRRRYEAEVRRYEEERLRVEEDRRRIEAEHRRVEEERRRMEEERRRAEVYGQSGYSGAGYSGAGYSGYAGYNQSHATHYEGGRGSAAGAAAAGYGSVRSSSASSSSAASTSSRGSSSSSGGGVSVAAAAGGAGGSDSVANLRPRGGGGSASSSSGSEDTSHFAWEAAALNPASAAGKTPYGTPAHTTVLDLGVDAAGLRGAIQGQGRGQSGRQGSVTVTGSRTYEAEYEDEGEARAAAGRQYGGRAGAAAAAGSAGRSEWSSASSSSSSSHHAAGAALTKDEEYQRREDAKYYSGNYQHSSHADEGNGLVDGKTSDVQNRFKLYQRIRRDTDGYSDDDDNSRFDYDVPECNPVKCVRLRCSVGPLLRDQEAYVAIRSRLVVSTIKKISSTEELRLSSMLSSRITKLPTIQRVDNTERHQHEVFTQVIPSDLAVKPDIVPLWVVVLSAFAGTLILLLLIFLLWKCGFFKRNRPSNAPEKEPLNRNGHYQSGDEAL